MSAGALPSSAGQIRAWIRGSREVWFVYFLIGLAYVGLRLAAFLPSSTGSFPDSDVYLHVADQSLFSLEFLAGWRGWTVPLLYKLLPDSDSARSAGQLVLSIVCWLTLAGVVAWCVQQGRLRPVAFGLVLLFSLSVWITQWDPLILSESAATSLTAVVLAAWLALARAPGPWMVAAVLGATLLWSFARLSNAYAAVLALPFVLGLIAVRGVRREAVALAIGLVVIFGAVNLSLRSPHTEPPRQTQTLNIIGTRVLTSESQLDYFRDRGMPTPDLVRALAGERLGHSTYDRMFESPRFAQFLDWVRTDGRETLTSYLLTHPGPALAPVLEHTDQLFATEPDTSEFDYGPIADYRAEGTESLLPGPLSDVLYPPSVAALLAWLVVVACAAGWLAWRGAGRAVWFVPAIALLLQIPHAAMVWHGDANEVARHALEVGVMTRLSLLLLSIFIVDALLGGAGRRERPVAAQPSALR